MIKKREGVFVFLIIGLIACMSVVCAIDATLTVLVDDDFDSNIIARLKSSSSASSYDSIYPKVSNGMATETFSTSRSEIWFLILFTKNGQVLDSFEEGPFVTMEPMVLDYRIEVEEEVIENVTEEVIGSNETEEVIKESSDESLDEWGITGAVITGKAIDWLKGLSVYYYAGVIGFIFVLIVLTVSVKHHKKSSNSMGSLDNAEPMIFSKFEKHRYDHLNEDISKAKQKLKDAEQGLETLKKDLEENKNRDSKGDDIKKAEEKLKRDQEALAKLRGNQENKVEKQEIEKKESISEQKIEESKDNNGADF